MSQEVTPADYLACLESLTERVRHARVRAGLAVNREMVVLYWEIGQEILQRQQTLGWGAKLTDRLSQDLRRTFPDMKGLSPRNLKYMQAFADAWRSAQIVQQLAAQIPWFHNVTILEKVKEPAEREFYIRKTIEGGWSRSVLVQQIESGLFHRQGKAITNFHSTLPLPASDLARETLRDPYIFDFLGLEDHAQERDIENAMILHLKDTLVEMGIGFAFVGRQVRLDVGDREFFVDLLFYHLKLHCYVVVELKAGEFQPEFAGKLNFYLSAVDDLVRAPDVDGPSIGLLLCRNKDQLVAEYALRDIQKPIGGANLELTRLLPDRLKGTLPTVEALEAELALAVEEGDGEK